MTTKSEEEVTVPNEPTGGEAVAVSDEANMVALYDHAKSLTIEDPAEIQERILRQMMRATTADDILRAGEAIPAQDVYGVPLRVTGIRASESEFVDGMDNYLHIEAVVLGNGDHVTVSCGARDVCMKLLLLDMRKLLPVNVRIERSAKATRDGFYPVFLRPLDADGEPF